MTTVKSALVGLGRDSTKAIANGLALGGIDLVNAKFVMGSDFKNIEYTNILINSIIMSLSTLGTSVVNSMIMTRMKLPHFIGVIESQYGVDIITVILYLVGQYIYDKISDTQGRGILIDIFNAIGAILLGNYIAGPLERII
jgi:uncharacterized membrane protein